MGRQKADKEGDIGQGLVGAVNVEEEGGNFALEGDAELRAELEGKGMVVGLMGVGAVHSIPGVMVDPGQHIPQDQEDRSE